MIRGAYTFINDNFLESNKFFEEFNFRSLMNEIDQTPKKPINDKQQINQIEEFTLTPYGEKALNQQLNSPMTDIDEPIINSQHLTPYPVTCEVPISPYKEEDNIFIENYCLNKKFNIEHKEEQIKHEANMLTNNINIVNIDRSNILKDHGIQKSEGPNTTKQPLTNSVQFYENLKKKFLNEKLSDDSKLSPIDTKLSDLCSMFSLDNSQSLNKAEAEVLQGSLDTTRSRLESKEVCGAIKLADYMWDDQEKSIENLWLEMAEKINMEIDFSNFQNLMENQA